MGQFKHTIILVFGLIVLSSSSKSIVHSEAGDVLEAPSFGGCRGTYRIVPPGISILLMYLGIVVRLMRLHSRAVRHILIKEWLEDDDLISLLNKPHKGTQHAYFTGLDGCIILSSSCHPVLPSLAPLVMTTSVSGLSVLPKKGE
jgi:hypothetical protein